MNVGHDRHVAAAFTQTAHDMLQVGCVFHGRRRDAHDLATRLRQLHRLRDGSLRVHRVAGNHRLHANRIVAADANVAQRVTSRETRRLIGKRIRAVIHCLRLDLALPFRNKAPRSRLA